jgi:hypothetical protein
VRRVASDIAVATSRGESESGWGSGSRRPRVGVLVLVVIKIARWDSRLRRVPNHPQRYSTAKLLHKPQLHVLQPAQDLSHGNDRFPRRRQPRLPGHQIDASDGIERMFVRLARTAVLWGVVVGFERVADPEPGGDFEVAVGEAVDHSVVGFEGGEDVWGEELEEDVAETRGDRRVVVFVESFCLLAGDQGARLMSWLWKGLQERLMSWLWEVAREKRGYRTNSRLQRCTSATFDTVGP